MQPARNAVVEDIQTLGQDRAVRQRDHGLHQISLELGDAALPQAAPVIDHAHMVDHILQLAQVVRGNQHRGLALRHVLQDQAPHLPAHHRVETVHRLVQDQHLRSHRQCQPESGLLAHAAAQLPDRTGVVEVKGFAETRVSLRVEAGIDPGIEAHHVPGRSHGEVERLVRDAEKPFLHRGVFINALLREQDLPLVGTEHARQAADRGGFSRAVGTDQPVDRVLGDVQLQPG